MATDGHRLHSFKTAELERATICGEAKWKQWSGSIIPRKAMNIILELIKETKAQEFLLLLRENELFTALVGGCEVSGKSIDGTFPNWRQVVPNFEEIPAGTAQFDCNDFKAALPEVLARASINKFSKEKHVKISAGEMQYNSLGLGVAKFKTSTDWPVEIGFNLRYLSEMCSGQIYYDPANNTNPVKIIDRRGGVEKMGVLMPCRV